MAIRFDVDRLIHLLEQSVERWHAAPLGHDTREPFLHRVSIRHGYNFQMWHEEDQARKTGVGDDVIGRVKTYEAIVKGEDVLEPGIPESFKVLVKELQSLGLSVEVLNEDEEQVALPDEGLEIPRLGINLEGMERGEDLLSAGS